MKKERWEKNPTAKQIGDEAVETKSFAELSFSSNG
jgi:hypothetical protein